MEQEIRKILRCPICEKGRIADAPARAALSQYRLFATVGDEPVHGKLKGTKRKEKPIQTVSAAGYKNKL